MTARLVTVLGVWWCAEHNCLTEGHPDDGMCDVVAAMDSDDADVGCSPRELCFVAQRGDDAASVSCMLPRED